MIKKYWKLIASVIAGIFGILFIFGKKSNSKKAAVAKNKIDDNNKNINKIDGQLEEIKKQKVVAKKKVTTTKKKIQKTKQAKKQAVPKPKVVKSKKEAVKSAAANIRRRTRK